MSALRCRGNDPVRILGIPRETVVDLSTVSRRHAATQGSEYGVSSTDVPFLNGGGVEIEIGLSLGYLHRETSIRQQYQWTLRNWP